MNKVIIIGLVLSGMILGIWSIFALQIISIKEDDSASTEPILGNGGENSENEPKQPGRNLSIEFDEKMGLSAP